MWEMRARVVTSTRLKDAMIDERIHCYPR